jgi:hypothetical protein
MRELPRTAPHEGLWVVYALRAAFAGTDSSSMPLVNLIPRVDVINTFRVFAGHFECFRVVSRSQIQRFRSSARFLKGVRFPAAPQKGRRDAALLLWRSV